MNTKPTRPAHHITCLAAALLFSTVPIQVESAVLELANPSFEGLLNVADSWTTYNNDFIARSTVGPSAAHQGSCVLHTELASGGAANTSGAYQDLAAQPGQEFTFSGYALDYANGLRTDYYAALRIAFTDSSGTEITPPQESNTLIPQQANEVWTPLTVTATAPSGTAGVRFYASLVRGTGSTFGSWVWFDDVSATVSAVPEPSVVWAAAIGVIGAAAWGQHRRRTPAP
jgi:hypothetical protein